MPKRKGRPPFEPTLADRNLVRILACHGISQSTIASAVDEGRGIDAKTLQRHFKQELVSGMEWVKGRVIASLIRSAINGNVNAQKFYLATHGGPEWRVSSFAGGEDGPMNGGGGNTTIIIRGGLAEVMHEPPEEEDVIEGVPNGAATNGSGHPPQ